jgi:outer membrane receptor protein involved in Fe transport
VNRSPTTTSRASSSPARAFRRPNLVTASPVTQVTGEDIDVQGVTRVEDLINELPQAFAAQGANVSNGASGTATIDLRGLGTDRTLVLVDGRRLPFGSPLDTAADLNQIPGQLIDRVEVLTGGASAVYGSDAIAGVVNFIFKRNFEGVQVDAQYNFYQHHNEYDGVGNLRDAIRERAATNPSQFALPDDIVADGQGFETTLLMGINSPDDRGNITAYVGYRTNNPVLQSERDYSACALGSTAGQIATSANTGQFVCGGSGTAFPGTFTANFVNNFTIGANNTFRPFNAATDQYNFGPLNYYQRPDERYVLGAIGRYEFNDRIEAFTQLMFTDYSSVAQIAPSGNFFNTDTINCGNPLLSAQQRTTIGCTAAQVAADARVPLFIGRRNVEGGGRQDDLRYQSYRALIGLRGDLGGGFDYDIAASHARVQLSRVYRNEFSTVRLARALDVVNGPNGQPTCRSVIDGTDPNCVPYNIFTLGGVTQEALNYVQIPLLLNGSTEQNVVTAAITGDLGERFGVMSPFATRGVQFAAGVEYRRDALVNQPDVAFQTGEGAGQGGPTTGLQGSTAVYDTFAEVEIPLVEDRRFVQELSLNGAYRYSDYNTGVSTDTYTINGIYSPVDGLRFRGGFSKAVRAPNVVELFTTQGFGLFDLDEDPCGTARSATLAQCVATGVPAANYGTAALDSPAGQYNELTGGNPNLEPEEAETVSFGVVFTPRFLPGFDITVDYFDIEVQGLVSSIGSENTLNLCYQNNDAAACDRINRNALGQLWVGDGFVENLSINIGGLKTSGVDVNANYAFPLDRVGLGQFGRLTLNYVATFLNELETDTGVGRVYDCVGFYGSSCGIPNPEYRHRARATLQTPIDLDLNVTWRYFGEVELFEATNLRRLDRFFEEQNYFDVAATYRLMDRATFRIGVNNVLDEDPPISASVGAGFGNGNTYPQVYDALGRYIFTGITLDF